MSIHSLGKLFSIYEGLPGSFLKGRNVDSYFNHKNCASFQSHHRLVRVSRVSSRNKFAFDHFEFCDIRPNSVSFSKKKYPYLEEKLLSESTIWVIFETLKNKPTNPHRFLYRDTKVDLAPQGQETTSRLTAVKKFDKFPTVKIIYVFVLKKTSVFFVSRISTFTKTT